MIESLSNKTLSPHKYDCSSKDIINWSENNFSLFHFTEHRTFLILRMHSRMFYKIDALENFAKFTGNRLYQNVWLPQRGFPENFSKILGTLLSDCFLFQFNLPTVLRRFCFRTDQYLFNISNFSGYIKIHGPRSLVTFFTQRKYYWGKITLGY